MKKLLTAILFILVGTLSALANDARESCKAMIRRFEGLRLEAYQCAAGVWTIGYGHTRGVHEGMKINKAQAEIFLDEDVDIAIAGVKRQVHHWSKLNDNQLYALVDFTFNCGEGRLHDLVNHTRTSYPDICRLNCGDYESIRIVLPMYNKANGKELRGLTERRKAEVELFYRKPAITVAKQ